MYKYEIEVEHGGKVTVEGENMLVTPHGDLLIILARRTLGVDPDCVASFGAGKWIKAERKEKVEQPEE